jgi:outer membrane immunogenic protein
VDYFGTVRGRLGYAFGGTLLYATGGFAYGGVRSSASFIDNTTSPLAPLNARTSNTSTATGWVAGAGIEYKISPSWSLKGEYQYIDLGSGSDAAVPAVYGLGSSPITPCAPGSSYSSICSNLRGRYNEVAFNTVRIGVNYNFNTPYEPLK